MIDQPYPVADLIKLLNTFYERATGLEYGQEHEVMHCAAIELQKQQDEIKQLREKLEIPTELGTAREAPSGSVIGRSPNRRPSQGGWNCGEGSQNRLHHD